MSITWNHILSIDNLFKCTICEWYLLTFIITGVRAARVGATGSTCVQHGSLENNAGFSGRVACSPGRLVVCDWSDYDDEILLYWLSQRDACFVIMTSVYTHTQITRLGGEARLSSSEKSFMFLSNGKLEGTRSKKRLWMKKFIRK